MAVASSRIQWQEGPLAIVPAMHRVVVPVAPHTPLLELAVPCAAFGLDRSDIVQAALRPDLRK